VATDGSGSNATAAVTIMAVAVSPLAVTLRAKRSTAVHGELPSCLDGHLWDDFTAFGVYTAPASANELRSYRDGD
jgi:hypothetical protein